MTGCLLMLGTLGTAGASVSTTSTAQVLIQLVDLDPNDGIAPSLTFGGGVQWTVGSFVYDGVVYGNDEYQGQSGEGWSRSVGTSIGVASAFASSESNLALGTAKLRVGSTAEVDSEAYAGAGWFSSFEISARTKLDVTVTGQVLGTSSGNRYKDLTTQVGIELFGAVGGEWVFQNPSVGEFRTTAPGSFSWTPTFAVEKQLFASFANTSAEAAVGGLNISVSAISRDGAVAGQVPEPATWLAMLVGVAGVCMRTRYLAA
jgi:hypothetical protein